jgi:Dynamin central region
MVKNRLASEARANVSLEAAREKETKLFQEKEWTPSVTSLQQSRLGIDGLRTGLSSVFCSVIRTELPAFNEQTRTKLAAKRAQLESLGPARGVLSDQREYLKSIVSAYQLPKYEHLSDDYRSYGGFGSSSKYLLQRLASYKKEKLQDRLETSGMVWKFKTPKPDKDEESDQAASETHFESTKNIYTWINHRYQTTKSRSLPGIVPYPLVERLFEEQTANWAGITSTFVKDVRVEFKIAVDYCLRCACQNKEILAELEKIVLEAVEAKLGAFLDFCLDLIKDEQNGMQVVASEKRVVNDVSEARTLRFMSAIARLEDESHHTRTPSILGGGLFGGLGTGSKPTTGGLFGGATTGGFGSVPRPYTGGLFGGLAGLGSVSSATSGGHIGDSTTGGIGSATGAFGGSTTGGFGSTAPKPTTGGVFGSTASDSSTAKPATSSGLFGSTPSSGTKPATNGGVFGSLSNNSTTAKPATTSGVFGSSPSNNATTKPAAAASPFGSIPSRTAATEPTASGTTEPARKPAFGGGLGGFGSTASTSTGFGTTNAKTSVFGASESVPEPTTGGGLSGSTFGAPPKPLTSFLASNQSALREVLTHDRQVVYEIHDVLKAYYRTSVQHYADSVCKNGLNQLFIEETMNVFSNEFVDALPDKEVERIAAESMEDRRRRRKLRSEVEALEGLVAESEALLRQSVGSRT